MLSQSKPRGILRAKIAEQEQRRQCVEVIRAAIARADGLLNEAQARLAEFADLDAAIASHCANAVKAWATSGGKRPNMEVPGHLLAQGNARDAAQGRVEAAESARRALLDELETAQSELLSAIFNTSQAAQAVIFEEAELIAARLHTTKCEVWDLTGQLHGLARLWVPNNHGQSLKPVELPDRIVEALTEEEPQHASAVRPEMIHAAAWQEFYSALQKDHEAHFSGV